ncbi:uncharacterized protein LOC143599291 [Bidens hawaiensis]|uniref:uncharacterized protein LOC143599291 n=1 Tax=Bidens hawaiensis TaxID=980011 RepID=UPI00404982D0
MDIDDNDAQDQHLHIVEEESSKVSPVSPSYSLPKFEFDDSLQGHLRFDNLVDNEAFLEITSQEDNHWIEEYSTAVKPTRKNVWSEATSSESVEMLLKSVGQEEKVLEESNRYSSLTNVMDPKGTLESVGVGGKSNSSVGEETLDKIGDDVSQEASKIPTESLANELQDGNAGSSQNVENASDVSKNECHNDPDNIIESKENSIDSSINNDTVAETVVSVNEETENGVGSDVQRVTLAETAAEVILSKDDTAGNTDVNDDGAADSSKNADSNMDVLTDDVVAAESSKVSSLDTTDGVQLPPGTAVTSDVAPEVEQGTVSDGAEKGVHFNAGQREQTGDADSARLLDPKELKTGEDGTKPLNLSGKKCILYTSEGGILHIIAIRSAFDDGNEWCFQT